MDNLSEAVLNLNLTEDIFKGIKFFISGEVHEKVVDLLKSGGAERLNYFSDYVTHLIVGSNPEENDIVDANDVYEVPALTSKWVVMCAQLKKLVSTKPYLYVSGGKLLSNLVFCFSSVREDLKYLWSLIAFHGGIVQLNLTKKCDYLITTSTNSDKYQKADSVGPENIKIVTPDWLVETVKSNALADATVFHPKLINWPKPVKHESTTAITGFEPEQVDDSEKDEEKAVSDSTQALLEKLKQRMPWNQPSTPKITAADPVAPPNVVAPSFIQKGPNLQLPRSNSNQSALPQPVPESPVPGNFPQVPRSPSSLSTQHIPRSIVHHTPAQSSFQDQQTPLNIGRLIGQPQARPNMQQVRNQLSQNQLHQQLLQQRMQQNQQNMIQRTSTGQLTVQQQLLQQQLAQRQLQNQLNQQQRQGTNQQGMGGQSPQHMGQLNQQQIAQLQQQQLLKQNQQQQLQQQQLQQQQLQIGQNQQQLQVGQNQQQIQIGQNQQQIQIGQNQQQVQVGQNQQQIQMGQNQQHMRIGQNQHQLQIGQNQQQQIPFSQNQQLLQNQVVQQQSQLNQQQAHINQQQGQLNHEPNQTNQLQQNQMEQQNQIQQQNLQQQQIQRSQSQNFINQNQPQKQQFLNQHQAVTSQQQIMQNQSSVGVQQFVNQQNFNQNQNAGHDMNLQSMQQQQSMAQPQSLNQQLNAQLQNQQLGSQNLGQHFNQQQNQMNQQQTQMNQPQNQMGQQQNQMNQQQNHMNQQQNQMSQQQNQVNQQQNQLSQQHSPISQQLTQQNMLLNQQMTQQSQMGQAVNQPNQMGQALNQQDQLNQPGQLNQLNQQQNVAQQQSLEQGLAQNINQALNQQLNQGISQHLQQQNLQQQQQQLNRQNLQQQQQLNTQQLSNQQQQQSLNQQQQQISQINQSLNSPLPQQVVRTQFQQQGSVGQQILINQQAPQTPAPQRAQINQHLWAQQPSQVPGQQIIRHSVNVVQQPGPRVQWSPNPQQANVVPQRQFIQLDARTHNELQKMPPEQQALFVAKLQRQRQLLKQVQQRGGGGSHILIRGSVPPGLTTQQQFQWLQQQAKQQGIVLPPNIQQQSITPGTLTQPALAQNIQHTPGLSPINQNNPQFADQNQQQQLQLRQYRLQQLQLQREQAQKNHLAQQQQQQQGPLQQPTIIRPIGQPQLADSTTNPPAVPEASIQHSLVVNAKTKTALANMLSIKLQSGGSSIGMQRPETLPEPSAAGTLRLMTAQHNAALNSKPQEIIALQRRTISGPNGEIIKPPGAQTLAITPTSEPPKLKYCPKPTLPLQHQPGPFYGHNPNLKLPPDLFLLGCIFVVVELESFLEDRIPGWQKKIEKHGGEVEKQYCSRVTHVLCKTQRHGVVMQALRDCKRCVTIVWLSDVFVRQQVLPPWTALHLPKIYLDTAPASKHLISISGFEGSDRTRVKHMIESTGAKCTTYFSRHNTILIAAKAEGKKCVYAKKWQIPVVNVQWLTDVMLGNFTAMNQLENQVYQQFPNPPNFTFDPKLVPNLMLAWKAPINISQESYERVKRSASPVVLPKKTKKQKTEPTDENDNISDDHVTNSTHRILFSMFPNTKPLQKMVRDLGGSLAKDHMNFTHLVMPQLARSHKLIFAVARGAQIVSEQWLKDSHAANQFLPENNYALNAKDFNSLYKCNIDQTLSTQTRNRLFEGKFFFVTPGVFPSKRIVVELIQCCGGTVERIRRSAAQIEATNINSPYSYFIITHENDLHLVADLLKNKKDKMKIICNVELIFSAILKQTFEFEPYVVCVL
ncbi:hypothetical protein NQ315_012348 [Exocentrus adspersus]|uniref:PAX-interacting protein 1 n=1 Tax=Exocentrus adspersus TaxID=1586481 RepID=A0AAV8V8I8_9CUCU|nr:hypothetical protein NQ315_012348 [Exocentrus adspersus]